jgi:hypothetical protein
MTVAAFDTTMEHLALQKRSIDIIFSFYLPICMIELGSRDLWDHIIHDLPTDHRYSVQIGFSGMAGSTGINLYNIWTINRLQKRVFYFFTFLIIARLNK